MGGGGYTTVAAKDKPPIRWRISLLYDVHFAPTLTSFSPSLVDFSPTLADFSPTLAKFLFSVRIYFADQRNS